MLRNEKLEINCLLLLFDVNRGRDEGGDPLEDGGGRLHLGLAAPVKDVEQAVQVVALHLAL